MTRAVYAWVLVGLLWVVAALNYLDRQVIFSVFPLIRADVGASDVQLGLLATAFLWVYGFLSPLGGYLADRLGRRPVILGSLLVWSAVTWLTGHATSYSQLLAARALMGVSEACYLPAALALIADYHGPRTRSLATGLHQSGLYAGVILGGAGGGWMGQHYGWRTAFIALGIAGIIYGIVLIFALRKDSVIAGVASPGVALDLAAMIRSRPLLILVAVNSLTSVAYWCVYTWLPLHLFERFRMDLATAGFTATFYIQIASFAGILGGGILADTWARRNRRARIFTQSLGLAAAGPFLVLAAAAYSEWILIPALVLFGLGRGFFDCNLMPVVCECVSPGVRATVYGILNLTSCIAGGAMAAAAGALKQYIGLGGAIQLSGALLLAAAALALTIQPDRAAPEA